MEKIKSSSVPLRPLLLNSTTDYNGLLLNYMCSAIEDYTTYIDIHNVPCLHIFSYYR